MAADCPGEALEGLMRLAKLRVEPEEACRAVRDIEAMLEELRSLSPGGEPLYYIWEEGEEPPAEPVEHEPRGRSLIPGDRLDSEGRALFPWRGPAGGEKG